MHAEATPAGVAVVTGAARGIGLEVARVLSARGWTIVAGARDLDALAEVTSDFATPVVPAHLDVTDDDHVAALDELLAQFDGGVQALVNNAGIVTDGWSASVLDAPLEVFRSTWETNALGALRVTRAVLPHLRRSASPGRIVNVSSGMGQLAEMGGRSPAYRTSKTLLNALTRILAAELDDEVFVASVCPGWVRTDMGGDSAPRSVEQGADTIVWLASGDAPDAPTGLFWRDRETIAW
jgi:NAD(P)-dependent dehydrogenase (short-subunit alcohol dehydrogenase family)